MRRVLTDKDVEAAVRGGAVYAAGAGGWAEHGRRLGRAAVDVGAPVLVRPEAMDGSAWIGTASTVGAHCQFGEWELRGADHIRAVELLVEAFDERIAGLMTCENGPSASLDPWLPAAVLGCPVIDAVCDMRAHPPAGFGALGRAASPEPVIQTAVGGSREDGRYVEMVLRGAVGQVGPVMRRAAEISGGAVASAGSPVPARDVVRHAVTGGVSQVISLGEAIMAAERRGTGATFDAILCATCGALLIEDVVTAVDLRSGAGGFDLGRVVIGRGERAVTLHVLSSFMAIEDGAGLRLASYPDLIAVLSPDALPLSVSELGVGMRVHVLHVPRGTLPLSSGAVDPAAYAPCAQIMGIELASPAML